MSRVRFSGVRKTEISVFVYNLPRSLDQFGVAGIFQKAGTISDVYLPHHQRFKSQGRYGFVRFHKLEDARRCIKLFNGGRVRGQRISVSMANPKKQSQSYSRSRSIAQYREVQVTKDWRRMGGAGFRSKDKRGGEEQSIHATITGQVNDEFEVWLARSLVCTTEDPRDLATLASAVMEGYGPGIKVSALSCCKFLLIFPTVECMTEALEHQEELEQWFIDIKRWGIEDCCETRRVWLDVIGVPPHGWMWENFKQIAELWGSLICLGKSSSNTDSFEVMRILIATKSMQRIEAVVLLEVGYGGYKILVKEAETISQMSSNVHQNSTGLGAEDHVSNNDIPGFEDIDDNLSHQSIEEEGMKTHLVQKTSNGVKDKEPPSSNESRPHVSSRSRTKTVSFSQNGYSEELMKLDQHLRDVGNTKGYEESQEEENLPPPGFEAELGRISQGHKVDCTNQKSQHKQHNPAQGSSYKKALLQSNSVDTGSTSESLIKLAHEALHIGELLGVRVTGNVEAAVSRITSPLKKSRKQGKRSKNINKV